MVHIINPSLNILQLFHFIANNILACPSLVSWLRTLYGRLRVQRFQRRRQDQQHKNKIASNVKGENYNGKYIFIWLLKLNQKFNKLITCLSRETVYFKFIYNAGSCINEARRLSEVMVPMINVSPSPTTHHNFENHARNTDETVLNVE